MARVSTVALALAAVSLPAPLAAADISSPPHSSGVTAAADPNQVICERVEKIGTRLGSSRVCMTRAEWAEQRRQNRDVVERAQQTRCESLDPTMGAGNSC